MTIPDHFVGRVQVPEKDIDEMFAKGSKLEKLFKKDFKLHPEWIYCRGIKKSFEDMKLGLIDPDNCEMTPEEELMFYFEKFDASGWKWKQDKLDSNETRCDRKLLQILLFDAKATEKFPFEFGRKSKEFGLIDKFDIKNSFISTHSGLLRYKIFDRKFEMGEKWAERMKKSIEEVWYRHTVDFNRNEPQSFVYSVPFNAYTRDDDFQVTATHAIFIQDGSNQVPVAVVGFQFSHEKLDEHMKQHVSSHCGGSASYLTTDSPLPTVPNRQGRTLLHSRRKRNHPHQRRGSSCGQVLRVGGEEINAPFDRIQSLLRSKSFRLPRCLLRRPRSRV